jgi:hypothetical protein
MPKQSRRFRVLRDFDFVPRQNVVRAFKAGQEVQGLTRACIARGFSLKALELIATQEQGANGKTDNL